MWSLHSLESYLLYGTDFSVHLVQVESAILLAGWEVNKFEIVDFQFSVPTYSVHEVASAVVMLLVPTCILMLGFPLFMVYTYTYIFFALQL